MTRYVDYISGALDEEITKVFIYSFVFDSMRSAIPNQASIMPLSPRSLVQEVPPTDEMHGALPTYGNDSSNSAPRQKSATSALALLPAVIDDTGWANRVSARVECWNRNVGMRTVTVIRGIRESACAYLRRR